MVIFSSIDYQVHSNVGFYIWELSLHGTFHSSLLRIYCILISYQACHTSSWKKSWEIVTKQQFQNQRSNSVQHQRWNVTAFIPNHLSNEVDLQQFLSKPKIFNHKTLFKTVLLSRNPSLTIHFVGGSRLWISLSPLKTTLARHGWTLQAVAAIYHTLKTRSLSILSLGYFRHSLCQSYILKWNSSFKRKVQGSTKSGRRHLLWHFK